MKPDLAEPKSPAASRIRWPAEWEPQSAVWLSWPHNPETWPGRFEPVPAAFARFVRAVAEVTPVRLLAADAIVGEARKHLQNMSGVEWFNIPTNDCWIRDYGPTFVHRNDRELVGIDWKYNAWGNKYEPWDDDAAAAERLLREIGGIRESIDFCVEGGAIETDGQGTLLTTPECIVTPTRNPGISRADAEQVFRRALGIREVVWLEGGGLEGDDTDGHIDQLARFISPKHIVCAVCDDRSHPNHIPLEANFRQLTEWGDPRGIQVHRLPLPPPRAIRGQAVPQCYCNFLITNRRVLVPTYQHAPSDDRAVGILRDLLPPFDVVGLDASDLVWGLGAFHCASQQQPAV